MERLRTILRRTLLAWWLIPFICFFAWICNEDKQGRDFARWMWTGKQ